MRGWSLPGWCFDLIDCDISTVSIKQHPKVSPSPTRQFLDPVKAAHPWISFADLWTFAGIVAIEQMGGPQVPWRPGRRDHVHETVPSHVSGTSTVETDTEKKVAQVTSIPPNGRLPDAAQGASHIRDVFGRMGFTDREMVALVGAHSVGRCHTDRSGYDGAWTYTPTRFSNQFYKLLLEVPWKVKEWDGPLQYVDPDEELMMLPADLAFAQDPVFRPVVEEYAKDKEVFFRDFASAFGKLLELGVVRDEKGVAKPVQGPGAGGTGAAGGCPFSGAPRAKL